MPRPVHQPLDTAWQAHFQKGLEAIAAQHFDEALTALVQSRLSADPVLKAASIQVTAKAGVLLLEGTLPTPADVKAFLADSGPDKRARAIDRVLERPEFVDYWSL